MQAVGFDTETYPIAFVPERGKKKTSRNAVPKLVVMSTSTPTEGGGSHEELLRPREAVLEFVRLLKARTHLTAVNLAYDVGVMVRAAYEELGEDILPLVFDAYEYAGPDAPGGLMHDSKIREQLIEISQRGSCSNYGLAYLAKRRLRLNLHATKSGPDVWRVRYNELDPYPMEMWPESALAYARDDARIHREVHEAQMKPEYSALDSQVAGAQGVENEHLQVAADWVLHLMSANGLKVDYDRARKLDRRYAEQMEEYARDLRRVGLLSGKDETNEYGHDVLKENQDEMRRMFAKAFKSIGVEPLRTKKTDKISLAVDAYETLEDSGYDDPLFEKYRQWRRFRTFRSMYMEPMLLAPPYAMCPGFGLVASGRTSSSKPNIQNFPKHDAKGDPIRASDIRRCFIPRPGNVFVNADYSTVELRCLAQICLNWGIPSEMAIALRQGRDLHTDFAAQLLGYDYDNCVAILNDRSHDLHKKVSDGRALAKVANFGYPGGLQPGGFANYARSYGLRVDDATSQQLYDNWISRWIEADPFFDAVRSHKRMDGIVPIKQHAPHGNKGNWRVRACDRFTVACNTLFQGMAADGAKFAMMKIARACYADPTSPLYGFRMNAFIHDEFLLEGPEARASAAADELARLMVEGMQMMVPDIPIEVEPALGRRWDVKMKSVRQPNGDWSIYDPEKEAA